MLSISMCLCLTSTALAAMADTNTNTDDFVYIWTTLQESGALSVGNDGLLHVDENNELCKSQGYSEFIELVNICNESIHDGILVADPDTVEVISVIQPEEEEVPYGLISQNDFLDDEINIMPLNAAHGCSVQACDLLTMCRNNYKTLSDYHMQMLQLVLVNPNLSPWGATVGFWVSKVEPGGDWDYKVRPGFAPYNSMFCSYFDGNFNHIILMESQHGRELGKLGGIAVLTLFQHV